MDNLRKNVEGIIFYFVFNFFVVGSIEEKLYEFSNMFVNKRSFENKESFKGVVIVFDIFIVIVFDSLF